jgi:PadR family transcriptional regulator, regulatory protein PadR
MLNARTALLQALIQGPGYGLQLADRVRERTFGKLELHQGTLYPGLRSLEKEGLLQVFEVPDPTPERGGRPRVYYKLTANGLKAAQDERRAIGSLFGLSLLEA